MLVNIFMIFFILSLIINLIPIFSFGKSVHTNEILNITKSIHGRLRILIIPNLPCMLDNV